MRALTLAAVAFVLAPSLTRADAIMSPPEDCAPGSEAMSSHWGQWCEDTTCASDSDCPAFFDLRAGTPLPRVCRSTSVCVPHGTSAATGPRTLESFRGPYRGPGRRVTGTCAPDGTCREGICDTAARCVLQEGPPLPPPTATPPTTTSPPTVTTPAPSSTPPTAATSTDSAPAASGSSCTVARSGRGSCTGVLGGLALLGWLACRASKQRR